MNKLNWIETLVKSATRSETSCVFQIRWLLSRSLRLQFLHDWGERSRFYCHTYSYFRPFVELWQEPDSLDKVGVIYSLSMSLQVESVSLSPWRSLMTTNPLTLIRSSACYWTLGTPGRWSYSPQTRTSGRTSSWRFLCVNMFVSNIFKLGQVG